MFLKTLALVFMFLIRLRFPKNLSLIQVIHKRYGNTVVKLVRKFEKLDFKHRKAALDLQFLKTCQDFKVAPKFLQFRVGNDSLKQSQTYQTCKKACKYILLSYFLLILFFVDFNFNFGS